MSKVDLTLQNFDAEVLNSSDVVLVDFWAPWCGPCQMLGPVLDKLAGEYDGKGLKIGKVDIGENEDLANKYQVMNIPTMLIFKNGQIIDQLVGLISKDDLIGKLTPHLS